MIASVQYKYYCYFMLKKVVLNIYDLDYKRDMTRIDKALEDLTGVRQSFTNYDMQQTTVVFDPDVITLNEITTQIRKLGFDIELDDDPNE